MVMHVSYEVRLPDHDFVKACKHKLVPAVYAGCELRVTSVKAHPEISYSGPTYIAVRSLKHDSRTAYTHDRDFDHVMDMEEFQDDGIVKPVAVLLCASSP